MPEPWEFQPEFQNDDFIDVSEVALDNIVKQEVEPKPQSFTNDVHLSDIVSKANNTVNNSEAKSHSVQETVKSISNNNAKPNPSISYFHPNSQIQLYHKQNRTAAVIRLGKSRNDLITVVVDLCFQHTGKAEDWQKQSSVAFSVDELLIAYHHLKSDSNSYVQNFKFHSQHKSLLSISCDNNSIAIDTSLDQKQLYLKGFISHKIKFMAMIETAINHYFATAFPSIDKGFLGRL
ncbi:hypothetical protein [Vibrio splendidus]|uniref:hypothetical protein n=1 Tax=Vibrio splendidus TaxID=29497 RepID=UPI003D135056